MNRKNNRSIIFRSKLLSIFIFTSTFFIHYDSLSQYTCQPVDFTLSVNGPYDCTDPLVNLNSLNPPDFNDANEWIYPGFIMKVWALNSFSFSNQSIGFLDNGITVLTEPYIIGDTLVMIIDHLQQGNYSFNLSNVGAQQFGYELINSADGSIAESGTFSGGNTTTNTHQPIGTWGYTITRVGAGPSATGVSNNPNSGGDGYFDPSVSGEGTFEITYSWDNGSSCVGTATKQVIVTCAAAPVCAANTGTISIDINGTPQAGSEINIPYGETANFISNGYTLPSDGTGSAGMALVAFSCPPTTGITSPYNVQSDPCYLGTLFGDNNSTPNDGTGTSTLGDIYVAYITFDNASTTGGPDTNSDGCVSISQVYHIYYDAPINPGCGDCNNPTCSIGNVIDYDDRINGSQNCVTGLNVSSTYQTYQSVQSDAFGTLGAYAQFIEKSSGATVTITQELFPVGNCTNSIAADNNNANNRSSNAGSWNPEWYNLTPNTNYVLVTTFNITGGTMTEYCMDYYHISSTCPSENTLGKLDFSAINPFSSFTPTTFNCNDGEQQIWKMPETVIPIGTGGELEAFTGFQMDIISGLSDTETSILISVNGIPYSYYGNNAPSNVLDWGSLGNIGYNIIEPYIPSGAVVEVRICDSRQSIQNIPYITYDHATGAIISNGTVTTNNNNCQTVSFTISSPSMTWDIDGDNLLITDLNNGSATFDPADLTPGSHDINYTFNNGNGCALSATQSITISQDIIPGFEVIPNLCQNSNAPQLQTISNNNITGTWNPSTISTSTPGTTTYTFTPSQGECATNEQIDITISPNSNPSFSFDKNICTNTSGQTLPLISDNSISGTWSPSTIDINTIGETDYTFTPNNGICANEYVETINIVNQPVALANPNKTSGKLSLIVEFENLSSNATYLNWDFGNGETSSVLGNVSANFATVGTYSVVLTASNDICPDDSWTTIITIKDVVIPNIFTPNGDGVNDDFYLEFDNVESYEAVILNRWGNEIISLDEFNNKWNGQTKEGKEATSGVYYIKYKITNLDKSIVEGSTFFHLER